MKKLHKGDRIYACAQEEFILIVTDPELTPGRFKALKLSDDTEIVVSVEKLREHISDGEWRHDKKDAPLVSPAMQNDPALDSATNDAMGYVREVQAYCRKHSVSSCQGYKKVHAKHQSLSSENSNARQFPSRATVYRYLRADARGLPLLCGDKNKGNRKAKQPEQLRELIRNISRNNFLLESSPWSFHALRDACNLKAHDMGLLPTSMELSRKFIRNVIYEDLTAIPENARLDGRTRAALTAIAKQRIRIDGLFQRVEQDALHLPFHVETPGGVSNQVYLIHAIDCATSILVGWKLVVGAPNASSGLQCVESILFSKKNRLEELGLSDAMDVYGTPGLIVFDNGPEAKNDRMQNITRLGISQQYCKSNHPHHKPFIERLNKSLKVGLETLPGCTRFDGKDGMRSPEALGDKLMTLEELEYHIVRWYYHTWVNTVLKRMIFDDCFTGRKMGGTPRARFQQITEQGYPLPLPPNRNEWVMTKYEHVERILQRTTGITCRSFNFKGANLPRLIDRYGDRPVTVLLDPDDFRTVEVLDEGRLVTLVNEWVDETTSAESFADAAASGKYARAAAAAEGAETVNAFKRDIYAASEQGAPKKARPKAGGATERGREVRSKVRAQDAITRAENKPLPAAATGVDSFMDLSLDDVPALSVVHRTTGVALGGFV